MGRTGRWLRSLFTGKKEHKNAQQQQSSATSNAADDSKKLPKEKRRWSFRRSVKDSGHEAAMQPASDLRSSSVELYIPETEAEQSRHAIAVAAATAAAADAAVAAAQAAAAVVRLTTTGCSLDYGSPTAKQERAAIIIQSAFRRYLAMKALRALKGLVKLQALVRGHMVRKQAAATLHCMQALVKVQARVKARRVRMSEEGQTVQRQLVERRQRSSIPSRKSNEMERSLDETAKIVEMDTARPNPSPSKRNGSIREQKAATAVDRNMPTATFSFPASSSPYISAVHSFHRPTRSPPGTEGGQAPSPILVSPTQSDCVTGSGISPRTFSGQYGHFEDAFSTAESSPQFYSATSRADIQKGPFTPSRPEYLESFFRDYSLFPNYMANTESSKAKARSQSAPKQRPDYADRYSITSKRRAAIAGSGDSRSSYGSGVRMQRSSSHVGINHASLNRSTMSLKDASDYNNGHGISFYEYYSSRR